MDTGIEEKTSYSRIIKHSSIYMFGIILSRVISFIMLPLYTRYLPPADYGVLELLSTTTDVIGILLGLGIPSAIFRFYAEKTTQREKNQVISTALISGSVLFFVVFALLFLNAGFFSKLVFGKEAYTHHFRIIFITMAFSSSVELPLVYLRARAKSIEFVVVSSIRLALSLSLNIWFIVFMGYGILGILYSSLIASVVLSVYLMTTTIRSCGFTFSKDIFKQIIIYGFPIIFSYLGAFVLSFSDRYFIQAYFNLTEVGLYSLGYKFGTIVSSLVMGPFFQHWAVEMFEIDKRSDRESVFVNIFDAMFIGSLILIFAEAVYIKEAIAIISSPEYISAYTIVPLICLTSYFSMQMYYVQVGILVKKKTKYVAYSTLIAVAVNLGLNFLLIPRFGMYGAGVSSFLSFFVRFIVIYHWSQKLYPIPYKWFRLNTLLGFSALLLLVSYIAKVGNLPLALLKDSVFFAVYLCAIYLFWLKPAERKLVQEAVRNPIGTIKRLRK